MAHFSQLILPLAIIGAAIIGAVLMYLTRPGVKADPQPEAGALVDTRTLRLALREVDVLGKGTVRPANELEVEAQITGRLSWLHPNLTPGSILKRGQILYRIEGREYALAVEEAKASLAEARARLKEARARHEFARREWRLYGSKLPGASDKPSDLVLRKPQLEAAEMAVQGARAAVDRASLAVTRTQYRLPFDALVDSESADIGDQVAPGRVIARLVGLRRFWVEASVPGDQVRQLVESSQGGKMAAARISWQVGAEEVREFPARFLRVLGSLDPIGHTARVLLAVDDPYGLETKHSSRGRLLLGAFVDVRIRGGIRRSLIELPRAALYDGDHALVVKPAGDGARLSIQRVEIVWRGPESVFVRAGLQDGDEVVVSRLARPLEGMLLRRAKMERR